MSSWGLRPFQTSAGRKTETSSDASDEAPERARKDAPKEAKLHYEGSCPFFCVFPVKFLRLPSDASHVRGNGFAKPLPRGKSICRRDPGVRPRFDSTERIIPKTGPTGKSIGKGPGRPGTLLPSTPAGPPGLSQPGFRLMAL